MVLLALGLLFLGALPLPIQNLSSASSASSLFVSVSPADTPCAHPGEALPQGRFLVTQNRHLYLCEGDTPLAVLSGVLQHAFGYLDNDQALDLAVSWRPRPDAPLRLHVYGLQHGTLPPIWRGSRMSSQLELFTLVPREGRSHLLVTLEHVGTKRRWVGHRWNGFGFVGICSAPATTGGTDLLLECDHQTIACTASDATVTCHPAPQKEPSNRP